MAKKLENMTPKQRMAYWEGVRKKEQINRKIRIDRLSKEQRAAVVSVHNLLDSVLDVALYPDLGGIRAVSAYDLQELSEAMHTLQFQFNLKGE